MPTILLIGDCPSPLNTDPNIPFVGSKSHPKLVEWCNHLGVFPIIDNSHTPELMAKIISLSSSHSYPVVALGNVASLRLSKADIPHFKLPHPSPRNRKLNDKDYIIMELARCLEYIKRV